MVDKEHCNNDKIGADPKHSNVRGSLSINSGLWIGSILGQICDSATALLHSSQGTKEPVRGDDWPQRKSPGLRNSLVNLKPTYLAPVQCRFPSHHACQDRGGSRRKGMEHVCILAIPQPACQSLELLWIYTSVTESMTPLKCSHLRAVG